MKRPAFPGLFAFSVVFPVAAAERIARRSRAASYCTSQMSMRMPG